MKKTIIFSFVFILVLIPVVSAFTITDGGTYKIEGAITPGGDIVSGTGYIATTTAGQHAIGYAQGGDYKVCLGLYCTYIFEPDYSVRMSGKLKYDDGRDISNKDVWIVIEYLTSSFIGGKSQTDAFGNFNARVAIPEYIYDKNFDINFYASGEVDAVYDCTYNQASDECS